MRHSLAAGFLTILFAFSLAEAIAADELAKSLRDLDTRVYSSPEERKLLSEILETDIRNRRRAANERDLSAWREVKSKVDWDTLRGERLEKLRQTVGYHRAEPESLSERTTGTFRGDSYEIENLVFESRPGLLIAANLYRPAEPRDSMPGILLCHSHHAPKTQGELQDMGISWARQGCLVLVMDQLGHGERRQHAFKTAADYPGEFRPSRQDYYFRYNSGMQLHVLGESLIGWMASDLSRGVDLLLARKGVDPHRIILLGAVAGGGDPAALTAALDERITAVVPFNFGGPQPETRYPLPADAEQSFNYFGGGSWESTRNITGSISLGLAPWVIVGCTAPRRLVYAHEFAWDQEHDPVWKRLQTIYGFYRAKDNLSSTHGEGSVRGTGAGNTHCTNIGPVHRVAIDEAFARWFAIPKPSREEQPHRNAEELACFTADIKSRPLHEVAAERGRTLSESAKKRLDQMPADWRRVEFRNHWLGTLALGAKLTESKVGKVLPVEKLGSVQAEHVSLEVEPGILVPLVLLRPPGDTKQPLVVAVSQHGKQTFLKERADAIAELLDAGIAVCLPDLRGTGESSPDDGRGRNSSMTSYSSSELMLGKTMVGHCVRDLRGVLRYLRSRPEFTGSRVALWGDSFAPVNPPDKSLAAPLDAGNLPPSSEPLGGLVALFAAHLEDEKDVSAVYARGTLVSFHSLLESPYVYVPHDVIIPGAIPAGDIPSVVAELSPRKVHLTRQVDGRNRLVKPDEKDVSPAAWLKEAVK